MATGLGVETEFLRAWEKFGSLFTSGKLITGRVTFPVMHRE